MNSDTLKCKVVMLATQSKSMLWEDMRNEKIHYTDPYYNEAPSNRALYIVSDREIKEGDWVLKPNNTIHQMSPNDMIGYLDSMSKATKKIEATTDIQLITNSCTSPNKPHLAHISKEFIEKYVKQYNTGEPIVDVMLELKANLLIEDGDDLSNIWIIKTREDNTVIIRPIKDTFTRDEILEILEGALQHIMKKAKDINSDNSSIEEWFNKNY